MKIKDAFRLEIRDLFSRRAIERLQPEVVNSSVAKRVHDRFTIAREVNETTTRMLESQSLQDLIRIRESSVSLST